MKTILRGLLATMAPAALLVACTWVEPDAGGLGVRVAHHESLGHCARLSEITVSVKHEVAGVKRNAIKVRDELESLARNEAANSGADTIQALGEPAGGEQRFAAYDCP